MKKSILICGQAGQGIRLTSIILGRALVYAGYYVFIYRDYGSLIKGGHNFNIITFSDQPIYSHQNEFSAVVDLDDSSEQHQKGINKNTLVLKRSQAKLCLAQENLKDNSIQTNNILLGILFKSWGLPLDALLRATKKEISTAGPILTLMKAGYHCGQLKEQFDSLVARKRYFFDGTAGFTQGALISGVDTYLSYPMTPATGLLVELAARAKKYNLKVVQIEDEIAAINAALGASYAGAMSMVGTSGGGFALMTEALGLAGVAEIPLVIYLAQRIGPATGVPTYTAQGDLAFARFAGAGEFPRVLIAPGNPAEAISRTIEAFYLAYRYRLPVILLSDKHLGESHYSFDQIETTKVKPDRFIVSRPGKDYQSYHFSPDGVSPRAIPGQAATVRATSYEHDQFGLTTEDSLMVEKMNQKRWRKSKAAAQAIARWQPTRVWGRGSKLIIGWGSTWGAIQDSLAELPDYRFLQISYLAPFPKNSVLREIKKSKQVVLVENSVTGFLGDLIAMETGCLIDKRILKYDGRPFTSTEIVSKIKKLS